MIDLVLDASPANSTTQQQIDYQTEVLTTLMEKLLSAELFSNEPNISNVCYLAARLVDKLWQGQLSRDPHEVCKSLFHNNHVFISSAIRSPMLSIYLPLSLPLHSVRGGTIQQPPAALDRQSSLWMDWRSFVCQTMVVATCFPILPCV